MTINNGTKFTQNHNHIMKPGLILSWNQCLNIIWTCAQYSVILLYHGVKTTTYVIRRCTRPTRYVTRSVRTFSSLSQTMWPPSPDLNPV